MNVNLTETNQDTFEDITDECPDDKSPATMEDYVNEELDDMNQNYFNDKNKIDLDE